MSAGRDKILSGKLTPFLFLRRPPSSQVTKTESPRISLMSNKRKAIIHHHFVAHRNILHKIWIIDGNDSWIGLLNTKFQLIRVTLFICIDPLSNRPQRILDPEDPADADCSAKLPCERPDFFEYFQDGQHDHREKK